MVSRIGKFKPLRVKTKKLSEEFLHLRAAEMVVACTDLLLEGSNL